MRLLPFFARIFFLVFFLFPFPQPVFAHELLPAAALEYLHAHPSATRQEIEQFFLASSGTTQVGNTAPQTPNIVERIAYVRGEQKTGWSNFFHFVRLGMEHILTGPDHVLFVLSLLLVFVSWKDIMKLTSAFTIAHTLTLVLAGTGVIIVSSRVVEPLIALSIAYVAVTSVFLAHIRFFGGAASKPLSVFFFGLFHGLGFAGLLTDIHIPPEYFLSSIFAFNVGIEMGQMCIIALVIPLILFCRKKPWYARALKIVAGFIAALALFWVVERIMR